MEREFTRYSPRRSGDYEQQFTEQLGEDVKIALDREQHRKSRKNEKRISIERSKTYKLIRTTTLGMDKYGLDGVIGLVPILGDIFTIFFSLPFIYVTLIKIRSISLSLAILYNTLMDVAIGLVPFLVGDVADFFFRSYKKNFKLIVGFVEDDRAIVKKVNKQATFFAVGSLVLSVAIYYLADLILSVFKSSMSWIGSLF